MENINCYGGFSSITVTFRHGVPKKQFHSLNKNWRHLSKRFPSLCGSKRWNNSLFLVNVFIGDGEFLYFLYWMCCCVLFKSSWFIKFWPINVFCAQAVTVWVWCFSWVGWFSCPRFAKAGAARTWGWIQARELQWWREHCRFSTEEPGMEMLSMGEETKESRGRANRKVQLCQMKGAEGRKRKQAREGPRLT